MNKVLLILAASMLMGCASVTTVEGGHIQTLGIAHVEQCEKFDSREDGMHERCIYVSTDAFSGWEAIMDGAAGAVVRIFTLGFFR
jgi:hypothetical protein